MLKDVRSEPPVAYSPHRLIAVVGTVLALLIVSTALLASVHENVRSARTRRHVARGDAFVVRNELADAVEQYRAALSLDRDHPQAGRALALTLLSLGRLSEAESYLRGLLTDDPTDGALNRGLARIHAARGRADEARAAYQRAIYGEWPSDALAERMNTRFELIEYLTRLNASDEVLAELLRLKAELPPGQTAAGRRVADLLVQAGARDLAIDLLSAAAINAPRDVPLLAHLAGMQSMAGRTADARRTLRRALAIEPGRADLAERLAIAERVLALDPTLPRLRLVTRTRRARLVLAAVVEQTRGCAGDAAAGVWKQAAARLRRRARADAEAAEQEMALAAQLWSAAAPACQTSSTEARAIARVLQRIDAAAEPQP